MRFALEWQQYTDEYSGLSERPRYSRLREVAYPYLCRGAFGVEIEQIGVKCRSPDIRVYHCCPAAMWRLAHDDKSGSSQRVMRNSVWYVETF